MWDTTDFLSSKEEPASSPNPDALVFNVKKSITISHKVTSITDPDESSKVVVFMRRGNYLIYKCQTIFPVDLF